MNYIIADYSSEEAALAAATDMKNINFRRCFDISGNSAIKGYPFSDAVIGSFSVKKTSLGARLSLEAAEESLPQIISMIAESGGVIQ